MSNAEMVSALTDSGDGVQVVVGRAGAGKTFALDAARAAWEALGPPGDRRRPGGPGRGRAAGRRRYPVVAPSTGSSPTWSVPVRYRAWPPGTVVVVDEAGMARDPQARPPARPRRSLAGRGGACRRPPPAARGGSRRCLLGPGPSAPGDRAQREPPTGRGVGAPALGPSCAPDRCRRRSPPTRPPAGSRWPPPPTPPAKRWSSAWWAVAPSG